jgi:hypothetical protein
MEDIRAMGGMDKPWLPPNESVFAFASGVCARPLPIATKTNAAGARKIDFLIVRTFVRSQFVDGDVYCDPPTNGTMFASVPLFFGRGCSPAGDRSILHERSRRVNIHASFFLASGQPSVASLGAPQKVH